MVFILVWGAGCTSPGRPPEPGLEGCRVQALGFAKRATLELPNQTQPVATLAFAESGAVLHVVYPGNPGQLATWRLGTQPVLKEVKALGPVGRRGVHFDLTGEYLAVVSGEMTRRHSGGGPPHPLDRYGVELAGAQIWHVREGRLLQHIARSNPLKLKPLPFTDVALSPGGEFLLVADMGGYELFEARTGKRMDSYFIQYDAYVYDSTVVAFDRRGEYFAYGAENANVDVFRWSEGERTSSQIGGIGFDEAGLPLSLDFHPTEHRVAVYYERGLKVDAWPSSLLSVFLLPPGFTVKHPRTLIGDVEFSPDGGLLAVADRRGVELRGEGEWDIVASDREYAATSVAFAPEGCVLAVGDEEGRAHVYELQPMAGP